MPAAYLTPEQATPRLAAYSITATPTPAELSLASDDLDYNRGPFVGTRYAPTQLREFPRDPFVRDDPAGLVPGAVLDWVALRAYQLQIDDEPNVQKERVDTIAIDYTGRGKRSRLSRLMDNLLKPYTGPRLKGRIV